jgi:CheY-like chemotaxis protein
MGKPKAQVLLIEDEAIIALAESRLLSSAGYEVIVACTGEEAIALFEADREIGLVISDLDLGSGMSGAEAIRAILGLRHVPALFLTGCSKEEVALLASGIEDFGYAPKDGGGAALFDELRRICPAEASGSPDIATLAHL